MTVREYIGARYVPLFMGDWDNTKTYEPLSIVQNEGNSYTSRQYVPEGIDISNEQYWAVTGNYNAQVEYYRQEVESVREALPSEAFDSENTVKEYIDTLNSDKNNVLIAALTNEYSTDSFVGISVDGYCFTPIADTKNKIPKTDVAFFKYENHYLYAATSNPITFGYTDDFVTFHQFQSNLGFDTYRNTNYPDASTDTKRWTPRFYIDSDGNVNVLVSMAIGENTPSIDGGSRPLMGCFRQTVEFNFNEDNFVIPQNDISKFSVYEDGIEVESLFDCDVIYKNGVYYLGYKNGYYNDVNIATSSNDINNFACISKNIFQLPFTEAISFLKIDEDTTYIYGQKYDSGNTKFYRGSFNLLISTDDFYTFNPIGLPNRSDIPISVMKMRNVAPIKIDNLLGGKLLKKVVNIGTGLFDKNNVKAQIPVSASISYFNVYYSAGRTLSVIGSNFYCVIEDNSNIANDNLYMSNFWNCKQITIGCGTNNKPRQFRLNMTDTNTYRVISMKSGTTLVNLIAQQPRVIDSLQQSVDTFDVVYDEETTDEVQIKTTNSYMCYLRGNINKDAIAGNAIYKLKISPAYNNYYIIGTTTTGTIIPFYLQNRPAYGCDLIPLVSTTENIRIDTMIFLGSNVYPFL